MAGEFFQTREQFADRHIVIPDMHGEYRIVERILDMYSGAQYQDLGFVYTGDLIDRQGNEPDEECGVYQLLEIVKNQGDRAVLTVANHEHIALAGMLSVNESIAEGFAKGWLGVGSDRHMEVNTLNAYGITAKRKDQTAEHVFELRERMQRVGHLALLTSASPYYETDKFIAVHAGIHNHASWEAQKEWLEEVCHDMGEGKFMDQPPQWWNIALAKDARPITSTDKIVVSGHAHTTKHYINDPMGVVYSDKRVLNGGRRVRLGSQVNAPSNKNAYIWQDWDGQVIEISNLRQLGEY